MAKALPGMNGAVTHGGNVAVTQESARLILWNIAASTGINLVCETE